MVDTKTDITTRLDELQVSYKWYLNNRVSPDSEESDIYEKRISICLDALGIIAPKDLDITKYIQKPVSEDKLDMRYCAIMEELKALRNTYPDLIHLLRRV